MESRGVGNHMNRLLVVSYSYKPNESPRAVRWSQIAEHWAGRDFQVDVLCAFWPNVAPFEKIRGVNVHRVGDLLTKLRSIALEKESQGSGSCGRPRFSPMNGLLRTAYHPCLFGLRRLFWPDYSCTWYFPARRKALELLKRHQYNGLITVSNPFTGHFIGNFLKNNQRDLFWLADIGDPFYLFNPSPWNSTIYDGVSEKAERRVFCNADVLTLTNESLRRNYGHCFPSLQGKIHVIPPLRTHSIPTVKSDSRPASKTVQCMYFGTLYKDIRSPDFLLLMTRMLELHTKKEIHLHFWGNINDCGASFELYKNLIGERIFLHGKVSRQSAMNHMETADFLINIGNASETQLPSKLVDYMSQGKPIINLTKIDDDTSTQFLQDYPSVLSIREGAMTGEIIRKLSTFIQNPPRSDPDNIRKLIEPYSVESVSSRYKQLLGL